MEIDHNYIIKLSFTVSLLGILMLLIILNNTKPNNNLAAQVNNENVKIKAKLLEVSNTSNSKYIKLKMEIKRNITGTIRRKELNKYQELKKNKTITITGTLKGNTMFINSIE